MHIVKIPDSIFGNIIKWYANWSDSNKSFEAKTVWGQI